MNGSKIRKLYLVDEQTLMAANVQIPPKTGNNMTENVQGSGGGACMDTSGVGVGDSIGGAPTLQAKQIIADPLASPYEKQVYRLDNAMAEILSNRQLPVRTKLLSYLKTIKAFLRYKDQVEQTRRKGVDDPPEELMETDPDVDSAAKTMAMSPAGPSGVAAAADDVQDDDDVHMRAVIKRKPKMFQVGKMSSGVNKKIHPMFTRMLYNLKMSPDFSWSRDTGEITIKKKKFTDSNIRELILHKINLDLKQPTLDPPQNFSAFDSFLKKSGITTKRRLRKPATNTIRSNSKPTLILDKRLKLTSKPQLLNY